MSTRLLVLFAALLAVGLLSPAFASRADHAEPDPAPPLGVATVHGTVPGIFDAIQEVGAYVYLADLRGFVERDDFPTPGSAPRRIMTGIERGSTDAAEFSLSLPATPTGESTDLPTGATGAAVQIYAPTLAVGQPGTEDVLGWADALSTVVTALDSPEILGGSLFIWSDDKRGQFPTGFGADGRLFTVDDPLRSIDVGWTLVDLDGAQFTFTRDATVEVVLDAGDQAQRALVTDRDASGALPWPDTVPELHTVTEEAVPAATSNTANEPTPEPTVSATGGGGGGGTHP